MTSPLVDELRTLIAAPNAGGADASTKPACEPSAPPRVPEPVTSVRRAAVAESRSAKVGALQEAVRAASTSAPWWMESGVPDNWLNNQLSLAVAFVNAVTMTALKTGKTLFKGYAEGTPTTTTAKLLSALTADGWHLAMMRSHAAQDEHLCADLVRDDAVMVLEMAAGQSLYMQYVTTDEAVASKLTALIQANITSTPPTGAVYALVNQGMSGIGLMHLGRVNTPLNPANYDSDVVSAFDRVSADLQSEHPSGRLVILEGPPGTGKSFWVRALVNATNNATFVLIPPDMVGSLAHPGLLPVLAERRASNNAPVVLILEDAEACLLPRKEGSAQAGAVSTLLNLADGIFGQLLDVRIVATTNTRKVDFDPAFLRPGRLSEVVTFGPLEPSQAATLLRGLLPNIDKGLLPTEPLTLAEVYRIARKAGWKPGKAASVEVVADNGLRALSKRVDR